MSVASIHPWKKSSRRSKLLQIIASVVPVAIATGAWQFAGVDLMVSILFILLPLQLIAITAVGFVLKGKRGVPDGALVVLTYFFGSFVMVLLVSVLWSVVQAGFAALSPQFIFQNNVYVTPTTGLEIGGVGHAVIGTLLVVGLSTIITVPLGIATGVYLTETRGKSRGLVRVLLQAIAGLPSIVSGLFVYSMLIVTGITAYAGWVGSLALIPLMLPTVARVTEESLRLVPVELRNGALGLGAPSWRAFLMVTLPAAKSGIVTAILLGIARVIGETAPLLTTTFAANNTSLNIFEGGLATLPTYIYNYISLGYDTSIQRAWGAALVLLILVGIIFGTARFISRPKSLKQKKVSK
ncbi:MAG: phosphate ABC transporter permease PstA [Actinomycetota bacterium]